MLGPEDSYGEPVDVWSVGCIFGEMLGSRGALFPGQNYMDQVRFVKMLNCAISVWFEDKRDCTPSHHKPAENETCLFSRPTRRNLLILLYLSPPRTLHSSTRTLLPNAYTPVDAFGCYISSKHSEHRSGPFIRDSLNLVYRSFMTLSFTRAIPQPDLLTCCAIAGPSHAGCCRKPRHRQERRSRIRAERRCFEILTNSGASQR